MPDWEGLARISLAVGGLQGGAHDAPTATHVTAANTTTRIPRIETTLAPELDCANAGDDYRLHGSGSMLG